MRLCVQVQDDQTVWQGEMGDYEVMVICHEIALAMARFRAGYGMDQRQEDAAPGEPKLCVEYNPDTQQFTWVRTGLSPMDTEIMCMIVIGEIQNSWRQ